MGSKKLHEITIVEKKEDNFFDYLEENDIMPRFKTIIVSKTEVTSAAKVLVEDAIVNIEDWELFYKTAAKVMHPDKQGGDNKLMAMLNNLHEMTDLAASYTNNAKNVEDAIKNNYHDYAEQFSENFFPMLDAAAEANLHAGKKVLSGSDEHRKYLLDYKIYKELMDSLSSEEES